jgi:hypothetical protein
MGSNAIARSLVICFVLSLAVPVFGCAEAKTMPEENIEEGGVPDPGSTPEPISIPSLEKFIFEPDEFTDKIVPRKLSPPDVAKFLIQRIDRDTKLEQFIQVEKAADFYDSTEIVDKYKTFLDRKESGPEGVRRSIVIARIIATLGTPEDIAFAKDYYTYLISKVDTLEEFEDLIELHERLGLGLDSGAIRKKIETKAESLKPKNDADYQGRLNYLKFQETTEQKMKRAEQVQQIKDKALRESDRTKRLQEEVRMYVLNEGGYIDHIPVFSARRLRRESWAAQPAEQFKRNDARPLKEDVVKSLRSFLDKLGSLPNITPENLEAFRLRLLRAIKYFDGKLSEDEQSILRSNHGRQVDILAHEGFLIQE